MKRSIGILTALIAALVPAALAQTADSLPPGWRRTGSSGPHSYTLRIDREMRLSGRSSLRLQSATATPDGFVAVVQSFRADSYLGRRVRFTGSAKTGDVSGSAGLWMRIDGDPGGTPFDNMGNEPLIGSFDWGAHNLVLDVPAGATRILIGALLVGSGTLWIDDLSFEIVDMSVSTTGTVLDPGEGATLQPDESRAPRNLGLEP